jgi:hypothetical protein
LHFTQPQQTALLLNAARLSAECLFHFFVAGMLAAYLAKLAELKTARRGLLVLGRRIVAVFAVRAL